MGSPKKRSEKYLESPTVNEKLRALSVGEKISFDFTVEDLTLVLEEVVEIFLPLTQWLDQRLSDVFGETSFLKRDRRAMGLFARNARDKNALIIMLDRSGRWLVKSSDTLIEFGSSRLMAEYLFEIRKDILKLSLFELSKGMLEIIKTNNVSEKSSHRYCMMWLLENFFETIKIQLKERERRINIMKERLSLFNDFKAAIITEEEKVAMDDYSIVQNILQRRK